MRPHLASRRSLSLVVLAAVLLGIAATAAAQELIPPKVTDRKYPQGTWCPLPFDLEFTPISTTVYIKFETNVWYQDDNDLSFHFTDQSLDNIYVSPKSVYDANVGAYTHDCYFPHPDAQLATVFYFENAGTPPLHETFAADPSAHWDLDHGAHWEENLQGGPVGAGDESTRPNGKLGLGRDTQGHDETASTQVTVEGLTAGQPYVLTGWWHVNDMLPDKITLTVTIFTDAATPVLKKTWGSVKQLYRGSDKVSD